MTVFVKEKDGSIREFGSSDPLVMVDLKVLCPACEGHHLLNVGVAPGDVIDRTRPLQKLCPDCRPPLNAPDYAARCEQIVAEAQRKRR